MPRVLLIEDDELFRASLRDALSRMDLEIVEANDRSTAQHRLHHPLDLIVTDLSIPGVEGTEVLDLITRLQPRIPVIVLSGSIAKAETKVQRPVRAWLAKPCSLRQLRSTISAVLEDRPGTSRRR